MRKTLLPITKYYVFDRVSQEEVFSRFFNISLSVIDNCLNTNHLIRSPIRTDKNPTMGFYFGQGNKIYCKDFNGHFHGDCLDAVAHTLPGVFNSNGSNFYTILEAIAKEFKIHRYAFKDATIPRVPIILDITRRKHSIFTVLPRNYNSYDTHYWYQYKIDEEMLYQHNVFFVQELFINDYCVYRYTKSDPAYAYYFGKDVNGRELWKVYFPKRSGTIKTMPRFYSNNGVVQGGKLIKKHENGCIIKSYKDVIGLSHFTNDFDIQGIAPSGESAILTTEQMTYVRRYWKNVSTWSDYDRTGILHGLRMQRFNNTKPYFLTNGLNKTIDFGAKDLTDYIAINGIDKTKRLIEMIVKNTVGYERTDAFIDACKYLGHYVPTPHTNVDLPF